MSGVAVVTVSDAPYTAFAAIFTLHENLLSKSMNQRTYLGRENVVERAQCDISQ